jgi:hypothetical protein
MGLPVGAQAPFTDGFTRRKSAPIPAFLRQLAEKENIITDGFTRRSTTPIYRRIYPSEQQH